MNNELGGKIIAKFDALRGNSYNYLTDTNDEDKIVKNTEKCAVKIRF